MAIDLIKRNQCHNFIIIEKGSSVGGTWHDNKYPGCCCDVWSMLYSYSFEQNPEWTRIYPGQEEILVRCPRVLYDSVRLNRDTGLPSQCSTQVQLVQIHSLQYCR
jgi:cation diffusion facilitator CzcD-associated flavoprotein CzcO